MPTRTIPDPTRPSGLRPVRLVTDRAKRYRANQPELRPPGPRICGLCGRRSNDKRNEEHTEPENLMWTCRSCNALATAAMKRARIGKRTAQFNPAARGARSLGAWVSAVRVMKGELPGDVRDAVEMIRATSPAQRSEFAEEIWRRRRREHGTDKWGVPF